MARLKTAYREKSAAEINSAEPNIPGEYLDDEDALQRETVAPAEPPAAPAPQPQAKPEGDEGTALLRQHIASAKRAEEIQHQRQAIAAAEQRRAQWLQDTPGAIQHRAELGGLHRAALEAGFDDLSEGYFRYLEGGLAAIQEQRQEQPVEVQPMPEPEPTLAEQPEHVVQETPRFFQPPPVRMPAPRSTAAMVSAPVSRSIPSADRDRLPSNPASVRLTPAQREAAKIAGVSELDYARGLVAVEQEKREGRRQP
jgi:hypothetical protein